MAIELTRQTLRHEADVFSARRRARDAASALGLDASDAVRVATALSEVGRVVVAAGLQGAVEFGLEEGPAPRLVIAIACDGALPAPGALLAPARRLMDSADVVSEAPLRVRMAKNCGAGAAAHDIENVRRLLADSRDATALDELRTQNAELLDTLEQLNAQQQELVRLNDELAETNRGVMAMYSQLSSELEETNRGVVALYADLDERSRQLREANAAKSRFLASVSHELRSPLNSILGLAELLLDDTAADAAAHRRLLLIRGSGMELLTLVNELLDIAKAEAGKLEPQYEDVDLAALFADLRATARPLTRSSVELEVDPRVGAVRTDAVLVARVLRNLLSNAAKFTLSGAIRLTCAPDGGPDPDGASASPGWVSISVADTGIGIDPSQHELVFEEFFQVPGPLQVGVSGSGLGLAYCRRVAQALGGTLQLQSEPGRGSTFVLRLPPGAPRPRADATAADARAAPVIDCVLIVDDEAAMRGLLAGMLDGVAGEVLEAQDGRGALEAMADARPDVVLLDLRMAAGDGYGVLEAAAADERLERIPIVVVTSMDAAAAGALGRLDHAVDVLAKSALRRDSLVEAVLRAAQGGAR